MLTGLKKSIRPKLSLVFQLSDSSDYEGGKFEFDPLLPQLPLGAFEKGSVIVFRFPADTELHRY